MSFEGFRTTIATNPVPLPTAPQPVDAWADDSLTYVCVTQDRLGNNKRNLPVVLPYVDRAVIVDGFSKDGTYEYLQSFAPKVQIHQRAWDDSFANQYNEYLKHIKGGWVLICDDDELPSEGMLRSLREIIKQSDNGSKFGAVEFRANDVSYVDGDWANRHDNGPCEYYRRLLFKWYPDMQYTVDLHQALQGVRGASVRCTDHYYHIKSKRDEYRNACRNYFIAGEWPSGPRTDGIRTPEWVELKNILELFHPEVTLFSHLNGLMVSGEIHPEVENWIAKYKDHGRDQGTSGELRAYYGYYFDILHPGKKPTCA